jgi:hypothetical protein
VIVSRTPPSWFQDAGLAERLDQRQDALVGDATADPAHQGGMVDLVKACLDVAFDDPLVAVS